MIGELFYGRMLGFLQGSHDYESLIEALDTLLPVLIMSCVAPPLFRPLITISAVLSSTKRKAVAVARRLEKIARQMAVQHRKIKAEKGASGKTRRDFLKQLLDNVSDKGKQVEFGFDEVACEVHIAL